MKDLAGKLALVTGAGSGIGRATALLLASHGARLAVVDVDGKRVEAIRAELGARCALAKRVDVSRRDEMGSLADEVHGLVGVVDLLVNNAGVGHGGGVVGTPLTDWDWVLGVNLGGVVHGCHFFVPRMVARGAGGHVVNVASTFGLVAPGSAGPYCTSKFAVVGLSESLRAELEPHGIGVSTICPGLIATDIIGRGRFTDESMRPRLVDYFAREGASPDKVARAIVSAIASNAAVVPVGPDAWAAYLGKRAAPRLWRWVTRQVEKRARS